MPLFASLRSWVAIDWGTGRIACFAEGAEAPASEPNLGAEEPGTREVVAVGEAARAALAENPALKAVAPRRGGFLAAEIAWDQIRIVAGGSLRRRLLRPIALVAVPREVGSEELYALRMALRGAGLGNAIFCEAVMAAAIGVAGGVARGTKFAVIDVGAGCAEGIAGADSVPVAGFSLRCGGRDLNRELGRRLKKQYGVVVPESELEEWKLALPHRTRFGFSGMEVTREEIGRIYFEVLDEFGDMAAEMVARCPDEQRRWIEEHGITLTGGTARLYGLAEWLSGKTHCPCRVAPQPETAALEGLKIMGAELKAACKRGEMKL